MDPKVSIIIPTKNGGRPFGKVLHAIFKSQTLQPLEVIVIDQRSTDGTVEIAHQYPIRFFQIEPSEFGHGRTRNQGAQLAQGDFIVFLNHDAIPATTEWLSNLVRPFEKDKNLAGVYGRQLPCNSNPCETFSLMHTYPDIPYRYSSQDISHFSVFHILFSDVNACIRKDVWEHFPLNENVIMSEDQEWAIRVLRAGYGIFYQPRAPVFHSNRYTLSKLFRRSFDVSISLENFPQIPWHTSFFLGRHFLWKEIRYLLQMKKFHFLPYLFIWDATRVSGFILGKYHRIYPVGLKWKMSFYRMYWQKEISSHETSPSPICNSDRLGSLRIFPHKMKE